MLLLTAAKMLIDDVVELNASVTVPKKK